MMDCLTLPITVAYGDVDRQQRMLLSRLFKLLQDAAITHANQFNTGTNVVAERGETWVLHRIEADITRYPRPGDVLSITTWSTGIKGFKGYRDFRVHDVDRQTVVTASSLWLYFNLKTQSITRVPRDVAAQFPVGPGPAAFPQLEHNDATPLATITDRVPITLRYADFDVNDHVNNAAYFDLVQTALARAGAAIHPSHVRLQFTKAIPLDAQDAEVALECDGGHTRFVIESDGTACARGEAEA